MTKTDQKIHPGEFFLQRRDKNGKWDLVSRDNDEEVMRTRFDYAASMLAPDEWVVLTRPDGTVLLRKKFDNAPVAE